jgi:hypothetical protein
LASLAGLAAAWSTLGIFGVVAPVEAFARAREAAAQAVAIDADYSMGHEIMSAIHLFHDWDLGAAADCLDRAIEIDPDSCNARHLRTLANRSRDIVLIPINPMFDPVRSDPRLQAFLKTALPKIVIDPLKRRASVDQ